MSSVSNEKTNPPEDVSPAEVCQCEFPNPIYRSPPQLSQGSSSRVGYWDCHDCLEQHPPYCTYCPYKPCTICYTSKHYPARCPYLRYIPRGVDYDWANYSVICGCGGGVGFDEENWFCPLCGEESRSTRLKLKDCIEEYPEDRIAAARINSLEAGAAWREAMRRCGESYRAAIAMAEAFRAAAAREEAFIAAAAREEAFIAAARQGVFRAARGEGFQRRF